MNFLSSEVITLIDIEPGMVVAGRYVVSTIDRPWLDSTPEAGAVCTALDAILDEPVLIHVADAEHSGDVLDAARRVSIIGDPRVAPTLDVGHSNGLDYVASSRIAVIPLGEVLPNTPLPEDVARALVGEIGTVLVSSARRGLFHMFLRPNVIGIAANGRIIVSGIGIDSALALGNGVIPSEDYTPTKASRKDALDLVRIYYAAVTGHWPGDEPFNGIPASGRDNARIVRAKTLNPSISDNLDDFISGILTGADPGPGSAAEVLGFLDDWDPQTLRSLRRAPTAEDDSLFDKSPRSFDEATSLPASRPNAIGQGGTATASDDQVKAALIRIGITRPGTRGYAAGVKGKSTGRYADRMQMREASSFPIDASKLDSAAKDWEEWEPEQTYSEYSNYADRELDDNLTTPILDRDSADLSDPDTQAIDIVPEDDNDTRVIMDDEEDQDGSWFLGGMFETHEQQREHQLREYERERRIAQAKEEEARRRLAATEAAAVARRAESTAPAPAKQVRRLSPDGLESSPNGEPPTAPLTVTPAVTARSTTSNSASGRTKQAPEAQSSSGSRSTAAATGAAVPTAGSSSGGGAQHGNRRTSRSKKPIIWILLSVILVAALIVGFMVVNQNLSRNEPVADPPAPTQPAEETSEPAEEEPAGPAPEIDKVSALDPEGDDNENDDRAKNVLDGEKGSWRTDRYNSSKFGNLKSGVGLLLELKDKTTVKEVKVDSSADGGTFEVRSGDDPKDAKKVGEGEFSKDGTTVTLDDGVDTDSLIIWVTELPKSDGGYRATISSVKLK